MTSFLDVRQHFYNHPHTQQQGYGFVYEAGPQQETNVEFSSYSFPSRPQHPQVHSFEGVQDLQQQLDSFDAALGYQGEHLRPSIAVHRGDSSLSASSEASTSSSSEESASSSSSSGERSSISSASSSTSAATSPSIGSSNSGQEKKKKHICGFPGCAKSFTTSGHLARHNRIHTGEKRYQCLLPGCHTRFSRQDNMLQHYRTHLSGKSRRASHPAALSSEGARGRRASTNSINLQSQMNASSGFNLDPATLLPASYFHYLGGTAPLQSVGPQALPRLPPTPSKLPSPATVDYALDALANLRPGVYSDFSNYTPTVPVALNANAYTFSSQDIPVSPTSSFASLPANVTSYPDFRQPIPAPESTHQFPIPDQHRYARSYSLDAAMGLIPAWIESAPSSSTSSPAPSHSAQGRSEAIPSEIPAQTAADLSAMSLHAPTPVPHPSSASPSLSAFASYQFPTPSISQQPKRPSMPDSLNSYRAALSQHHFSPTGRSHSLSHSLSEEKHQHGMDDLARVVSTYA